MRPLRGGKRAKELVRQNIDLFRVKTKLGFKQVRLDHVLLKSPLKLLRASLPASIQIVDEIEGGPLIYHGRLYANEPGDDEPWRQRKVMQINRRWYPDRQPEKI